MEEVGQAVARVKKLEDYVAGLKNAQTTLENSLTEASNSIHDMTKTLQQSEVEYDSVLQILDSVILPYMCSLGDICVDQPCVYPSLAGAMTWES